MPRVGVDDQAQCGSTCFFFCHRTWCVSSQEEHVRQCQMINIVHYTRQVPLPAQQAMIHACVRAEELAIELEL